MVASDLQHGFSATAMDILKHIKDLGRTLFMSVSGSSWEFSGACTTLVQTGLPGAHSNTSADLQHLVPSLSLAALQMQLLSLAVPVHVPIVLFMETLTKSVDLLQQFSNAQA